MLRPFRLKNSLHSSKWLSKAKPFGTRLPSTGFWKLTGTSEWVLLDNSIIFHLLLPYLMGLWPGLLLPGAKRWPSRWPRLAKQTNYSTRLSLIRKNTAGLSWLMMAVPKGPDLLELSYLLLIVKVAADVHLEEIDPLVMILLGLPPEISWAANQLPSWSARRERD